MARIGKGVSVQELERLQSGLPVLAAALRTHTLHVEITRSALSVLEYDLVSPADHADASGGALGDDVLGVIPAVMAALTAHLRHLTVVHVALDFLRTVVATDPRIARQLMGGIAVVIAALGLHVSDEHVAYCVVLVLVHLSLEPDAKTALVSHVPAVLASLGHHPHLLSKVAIFLCHVSTAEGTHRHLLPRVRPLLPRLAANADDFLVAFGAVALFMSLASSYPDDRVVVAAVPVVSGVMAKHAGDKDIMLYGMKFLTNVSTSGAQTEALLQRLPLTAAALATHGHDHRVATQVIAFMRRLVSCETNGEAVLRELKPVLGAMIVHKRVEEVAHSGLLLLVALARCPGCAPGVARSLGVVGAVVAEHPKATAVAELEMLFPLACKPYMDAAAAAAAALPSAPSP